MGAEPLLPWAPPRKSLFKALFSLNNTPHPKHSLEITFSPRFCQPDPQSNWKQVDYPQITIVLERMNSPPLRGCVGLSLQHVEMSPGCSSSQKPLSIGALFFRGSTSQLWTGAAGPVSVTTGRAAMCMHKHGCMCAARCTPETMAILKKGLGDEMPLLVRGFRPPLHPVPQARAG